MNSNVALPRCRRFGSAPFPKVGVELRGDSALDGAVAAFRAELDRLSVWCWQADYPNSGVCDGTNGGVEIVYSNKSVVSGVCNCYPERDGKAIAITDRREDYTFKQFCRAVSDLVGDDFT